MYERFTDRAHKCIQLATSHAWRVPLVADITGFAVYFWFSSWLPGWKERWLG